MEESPSRNQNSSAFWLLFSANSDSVMVMFCGAKLSFFFLLVRPLSIFFLSLFGCVRFLHCVRSSLWVFNSTCVTRYVVVRVPSVNSLFFLVRGWNRKSTEKSFNMCACVCIIYIDIIRDRIEIAKTIPACWEMVCAVCEYGRTTYIGVTRVQV